MDMHDSYLVHVQSNKNNSKITKRMDYVRSNMQVEPFFLDISLTTKKVFMENMSTRKTISILIIRKKERAMVLEIRFIMVKT